MTNPSTGTQADKPPTFERIEEYKAILDNLDSLSSQRQNSNNVYIGLNTFFLTALGFFLSSHFNLLIWSTSVAAAVISFPILVLNVIWRMSVNRYDGFARIRFNYLREIEAEFRKRRGTTDDPYPIGLFLQYKASGLHRIGNTQLERLLATFFFCLFPAVTLILVVLTWLAQNHFIPPLPL